MWRLPRRPIFLPGNPHHDAYRKEIVDKLARFPLNLLMDPLNKPHAQPIMGYDGKPISYVSRLAQTIINTPGLDIQNASLAYVMYQSGKEMLRDPKLWNELEFYLMRQLERLDQRMLFGCYYGMIKTESGSVQAFNDLQARFHAAGLDQIKPMELFELIEANSFNNRKDIGCRLFMRENILPRLLVFWEDAKFLQEQENLLKLIDYLVTLECFDPEPWEKIIVIVQSHLEELEEEYYKWKKYYEKFLELKKKGVDQETGVDFDDMLKSLRQCWENNVDYQWRFNLDQNREYSVHEMIAKADKGPKEMTWETGEKYIQHTFDQWYWDLDREIDEDVVALLSEYEDMGYRNKK